MQADPDCTCGLALALAEVARGGGDPRSGLFSVASCSRCGRQFWGGPLGGFWVFYMHPRDISGRP